MTNILIEQLEVYKSKISVNSVKEKWVVDNLPELYEYLFDLEGITVSEKIYLLENEKGVCKSCGSQTKFLSYHRGYQDFCSKKCSNNDPSLISVRLRKYKDTCLSTWGVDNSSKSEEISSKLRQIRSLMDKNSINEKIRKTVLDRYGVENPSQLDSVKAKKSEKSLERYGVENPFQSEEVKEKIKKSLLEKFKVNHPLKSEEIKKKVKSTVKEKYGVENTSQSDYVKGKKLSNLKTGLSKTHLNSDPKYVDYLGSGLYVMSCDLGEPHDYQIHRHLYHARKRIQVGFCTVCNPISSNSSYKEEKILEYVRSIYFGEVIPSYRDKMEVDVYVPDMKIGFEVNGVYWHSEQFKDKKYHLSKTEYFAERGIRIIHLWEDDILNRMPILESQISNWLGVTPNKIYARKCEIRIVGDVDVVRKFLDGNHIQGYVRSSLKIGLYFENRLVSLMTFDHTEGRKTMDSDEWNLSRFCNLLNTNVVGGASKLLKYFIKNYCPSRIISFSDREWSLGEVYRCLGFEEVGRSGPNYKYVVDGKRINKQRFKKSNLVKKGFGHEMSESEIMVGLGHFRIWDCGQIKFQMLIK